MFVHLPGRDLARLMAKLTDEQAYCRLCTHTQPGFSAKTRQNGDLSERFEALRLDLSADCRDIAIFPKDSQKEPLFYEHSRSDI